MLRAVLFDMGGTLDGSGLHWLDRFVEQYARAGAALPGETIRAAFDAAERLAATDDAIMSARLEEMVERHVGWQLEHLSRNGTVELVGADPERFRQRVVSGFVGSVRSAAKESVGLLATLKSRGLQLGVVSNACGNADQLCDDFGFTPYLSLVVDSRRVGLSKPNPAIYAYAMERMGLPASAIMMVGDSFERDIRPARSLGMQTAWLVGTTDQACPDRSCVDVSLRALADLAPALDARSRTVA
jgi:putative hydrolase of the HAD superfamily